MVYFWDKVDIVGDDECWEWTMSVTKDGHGCATHCKKSIPAHRLAYTLTYPDICILGKVVRHTCDNPACCNPTHLRIGTHADNVQDRVSRDRSACGSCNGRSKLTEYDVVRVIQLLHSGKHTMTELSTMYAVDRKVIYDIDKGVTWKKVNRVAALNTLHSE